jgi:hypothetical protein
MKTAVLLWRLLRARSSPRGIVRTNLRRPSMSLFNQFEPNGFQWCDSKSMKRGPAEQAPSAVKAAAAAL